MKLSKNLINTLLPVGAYDLFASLKNRSSAPYSLKNFFALPKSISDFFPWSPYVEKTYFIAENIRALAKGEKVKVTHLLRFYSSDGALLREDVHSDDDFFCRIEIKGGLDIDNYCAFTHHVQNAKEGDGFFENSLKEYRARICEQNRGYCIYYPNAELSIGSMVHGNFGGIPNQGSLLARQRSLHVYTPSYIFESHNEYDLVFSNPTKKRLKISIFYNSRNDFVEKSLESLGTCSIRIRNYTGTLSFESRLPICRPTIFKNPDCKLSYDFDVLHS